MAKWITSERQAILVQLWKRYGNKCLLNHTACANLRHYEHTEYKPCSILANPVLAIKRNHDETPVRTAKGQTYFDVVYQLIADRIGTKETLRLYEIKEREIVKDWIADDRAQTLAEYQAEAEARHRVIQRNKPLHGKFSGVSRDIFHDKQPLFYVEALGINGITFKPFAKVRLASSQQVIYVDISETLKPLSKHARRKAVRYNKHPLELDDSIHSDCKQAVKKYLHW